MKKKENLLLRESKTNSALLYCPHCGSDQVWRIQRSESEKILYYLSKGEYAVKKYLCKACHSNILIHANNSQLTGENLIKEEEDSTLIFLPCAQCGSEKLKVSKVTLAEEIAHKDATGKKAFRKASCLNCNTETIISVEDFETVTKEF